MEVNLKAMLEKRNALVAEVQAVADTVEAETRAFDDAELSRISEIKVEVAQLDSAMSKIKEVRSLAEADTTEGEDNMEQIEITKEVELRGLEQYLRRHDGAELRALTEANTLKNAAEGTAGNGGVTVPTNVYEEIIELLGEAAPVFERARKFGTVTGNLKIAREDDEMDEGFIGETADATKLQPKLKTVTLTQKRVGAAIQLTNQLINDSGVDIVGYAQNRLTRSVAKAIEKGILVGDGTADGFAPIIGNADVLKVETTTAGPTVEDLLDIYGALNPAYLDGAIWVVSRKTFNHILKLQDGDMGYLIFRGIIEGKPGYSLFGAQVFVSDTLTGENEGKIVFGNFERGYGMLIKKGMTLTNVTQDTTQALAGGMLSILDTYMDGAVFNPHALVVATPKA